MAERLSKISEPLTAKFGKKFVFKMQAILKEATNFQVENGCLALPSSLWPLKLVNNPVMPHMAAFAEAYAKKFHKRKIERTMLDLGQAVLTYRKRQDIMV